MPEPPGRDIEVPGRDELTPPAAHPILVAPDDPRALLIKLEPEAGRLLDRRLKLALEWFPYELVP